MALVLDWAVVSAVIIRHRPDLVYVNSTAAAIYLRPARWLRRPVILHVHESASIVEQFVRGARASTEFRRVRILACSPSVREDLARLTGRALDDVPMILSVPDDSSVTRLAAEEPDVDYGTDELVVGCCGAVERRKGADLWDEIAERVRQQLPARTVRFVWIGEDDPTVRPVGPTDAEFIGSRANPYPHIARFDVFALPSRDDPFPLVVIEAMLLGRPVVAFDVGGVSRQIADAGVLVPVGDVGGLADGIVRLLADDRARQTLGNRARDRALSTFSTRVFLDAIGAMVDSTAVPEDLAAGSSPRGADRLPNP